MRHPAVSGIFYPALRNQLVRFIENNIKEEERKVCFGGIAPHAGYIYSGSVAASLYSKIDFTSVKTVVLIGPNHTGYGELISLSMEDWETPLGILKNDLSLGNKILNCFDLVKHDELAHVQEHSIEVQLPFIQYFNPLIKIVPICMKDQRLEVAYKLGECLSHVLGPNDIIIASSDFSHYIPEDAARVNDRRAIEFILNLDYQNFYEELIRNNWSICGYGPILALMIFSYLRGCKTGELIEYSTSAKVNKDYSQVVGYASIMFPK